ncbi:transcriptional regulator, MarR family [Desulforamulus reducens MI-1]|uniref:HTH-type transcriptional regulator SarZ n=1 Tax=Desulforamulus reducens (strain ATCC BAA-1160 / DSM 100696 / MI-1) TaxID=349161 RepID=A4J418_DESRM|nr:MarR family transcriptional regulator [Desulforamulus reducens]ABO49821.1 transcriptional regulator, MarR family [Desulforamulus reducens MI-1]
MSIEKSVKDILKDKGGDFDLGFDTFKIEDTFGFIINRSAIVIRRRLAKMLKEAGYDITPEEFSLLSRLWEEDGIQQTILTEKTLKDKTRVTRLLNSLIKKFYVSKKTDEADRRNYIIYLTEEGYAIKADIVKIFKKIMENASEDIDQGEINVTKKVLRKISQNLNDID